MAERLLTTSLIIALGYTNLFVDIIWAGIVQNVSRQFSGTAFETNNSWGIAFLNFLALYLTAWRTWNYLREVGTFVLNIEPTF